MNRWHSVSRLAGVLLLLAVTVAHAEVSKLDPAARIALARLRAGGSAQAIGAEHRLSVSAAGELDVFIVGNVTRAQLEAAGARVRTDAGGVFTAWIPMDKVDAVAAIAGVSHIEGAQIDEVNNDLGAASTKAAIFRGPGPSFRGINGAGVIVGNVDTGVNYKHDDFKDALGNTRILKIWDQTSSLGPAPGGFGYGTEWNSAQLNGSPPAPGLGGPGDTNGHGSHTMGIAAGDGSAVGTAGSAPAFTYTGMAPRADIIAVDGSVSGSFSRTQMADGISYIFQQATALGKKCVVNCSIGSSYGPHDGTDPFEQTVDALSGPGKIVVLSAGNDRGASLHADWFVGNPAVTMSVTSPTGSAKSIAITGYYEATEQLNVSITTPLGTTVGPVTLGGVSGAYPGPLTSNGNVYIEDGVSLTSTGDKQVYIELNATNNPSPTLNGTWTITFAPVVIGPANGEVDLWRYAFTTSTANFVSDNAPSHELISALATGYNSVAAGAWVTRQFWTDCRAANWNDPTNVSFTGSLPIGNLANFSSPGPTRDGRIKPDVAGPGTAIISVRSSDTALPNCTAPTTGIPGNAHFVNQGTSMAAPFVTGAIALLYQKYGALTPSQVQTMLHTRAVVDGFVTAAGAPPNKDFGYGKLNIGDMTDPFCAVTAPNGGEFLVVGHPVNLTWSASDPYLGVTGVDIQLSRDGGTNWEVIALNQPNSGSYGWTITGPTTATALLRVTAKDAAGNFGQDASNATFSILSGPVAVGDEDRPITEFALDRISPSPTAGKATIVYRVPKVADVSVALFDLQGREVATLAQGRHPVGRYTVTWDGQVGGGPAAPGIYFVRLRTPGLTRNRRIVVSR